MIALTLKQPVDGVALEAENICPDVVADLDNGAIRALPVYLGRRQRRLDEFFAVDGEKSDEIAVSGDLRKVGWMGRGMTRGRLAIDGNAGIHLGACMKGGTIEVSGFASDWVGAEMSGGFIRVVGDAGGQVGAAYRGSPRGMTDGTIVIGGSAGLEVGMRMKRGLIVVGGPAGDFAGLEMKGGTIVLRGGADLRTGAWMHRGTIISLTAMSLLPSFLYSSSYAPTFIGILARHLASLGVHLPFDPQAGTYQRFLGDTSVAGKGEVLVWHEAGVRS